MDMLETILHAQNDEYIDMYMEGRLASLMLIMANIETMSQQIRKGPIHLGAEWNI